jgi:RNA polymerase sigma factor (sigma-70 family)
MATIALPPFQALIEQHGSDVLGFLLASVGPHDAEDCFQETFIAALRGYPKLHHSGNLRGWLLTIAHRKAMDHHRSHSRRPAPAGSAEEVDESPARVDAAPNLAPTPEALTVRAEGAGELWRAVSTLPPKQRSAVVLRFATGMSHREIGSTLDVSEDAARQNVHEGLKRLREEFAP